MNISAPEIISSFEALYMVIKNALKAVSPRALIIAIDGRSASGKTTLSEKLSQELRRLSEEKSSADEASAFSINDSTVLPQAVSVIHMDDFFLPSDLRTKERLALPGGNVHYERFYEEIYLPLKAAKLEAIRSSDARPLIKTGNFSPIKACRRNKGEGALKSGTGFSISNAGAEKPASSKSIIYRRFNCSLMNYEEEPVVIPESRVYIIEGAYSHRPEFTDIYDIKLFSDISPKMQRERILKRNGSAAYSMFRDKWIPMEERYFEHYHIKENSDHIISL